MSTDTDTAARTNKRGDRRGFQSAKAWSKRQSYTSIVRDFLRKRHEDVQDRPSLMNTDRMTQSSVWYRLKPKFIAAKLKEKTTTRHNLNRVIRAETENLAPGLKRVDLGIHAGVRAQIYYDGKVENVTDDNIDELVENGTDVIFIEKEGLSAVFAPLADMVGIALINTRGFATENADDLREAALKKLKGNNVAVFHDFDPGGVEIALKAKGAADLGLDPDLVQNVLHIPLYKVEQRYNAESNGHYKHVRNTYPDYEFLDDLKIKRLDIDAIIGEAGAEKLWKAVLKRLEKAFPTRNYTRIINPDSIFVEPDPLKISLDSYGTPDESVIGKLNTYMADKIAEISRDKKSEFTEELEDYEGIHEIETLKADKTEEYNNAIGDANIESPDIIDVCKPIIEELDKKIEQDTGDLQSEINDLESQIDDLQSEVDDKQREQEEIADGLIETAEQEKIVPAIKKLDEEKGYSIVEDAGLEEEEQQEEDEDKDNDDKEEDE